MSHIQGLKDKTKDHINVRKPFKEIKYQGNQFKQVYTVFKDV